MRRRPKAWLSDASTIFIWSEIDWKLYHLSGLVHLRVLALANRPRDVKAEVRGQEPVDAEAEGQRPADAGGQDQKVEEVQSPNQVVLDQRGQNLSWMIDRRENLIVFSITFSLPTNWTYILN